MSSWIHNYYSINTPENQKSFILTKSQLSQVVSQIKTPLPTPFLDIFSRAFLSPTFSERREVREGSGRQLLLQSLPHPHFSLSHTHTHPTPLFSFKSQTPTSPQHICFLAQSPVVSFWVKKYHDLGFPSSIKQSFEQLGLGITVFAIATTRMCQSFYTSSSQPG